MRRLMKRALVIIVLIIIFQGHAEAHWWLDLLVENSCRVVKSEHDYNNDGVADEIGYFSYNSSGKIYEILFSRNHFARFSYDSEGRLKTMDFESDLIVTVKYKQYYFYGPSEKLTKIEKDNNINGFIDEVQYFKYDDTGRIIKIEHDIGNNGTIDEIQKFIYDSNDRVFRIDYYDGYEEHIYKTGRFFYDKNGKLIKDELYLTVGEKNTKMFSVKYVWECNYKSDKGDEGGSNSGCFMDNL